MNERALRRTPGSAKTMLISVAIALVATATPWPASATTKLGNITANLARAFQYRDLSCLWRSPKSYAKVVSEIVKAAERQYYEHGRELTPESRDQLIQSLNSEGGHVAESRLNRRPVNTTTAILNLGDQAPHNQEIKDVSSSVPRRIIVDADLPFTPVAWERGEKNMLATTVDFFRDMYKPMDAAGRELRALYLRNIKPSRHTLNITLPVLGLIHTLLAVNEGRIDSMIDFGVFASLLVGLSVGGSTWVAHDNYVKRIDEMKFRDPGHLVKHLEHRLRRMPQKTSWSAQDVDGVIAMINRDIGRSLQETNGHLGEVHLRARQQKTPGAKASKDRKKRDYNLNVIAIVDSVENGFEAYPLTYEYSLDDVHKHVQADKQAGN